MQSMRMVLGIAAVLAYAALASADIVYTKDGKTYSGIIRQRNETGVSILLMDGSQRFFRNDEISRIDDTNKEAQMYMAAASALNIEDEGGLGYYYLARWCELHNQKDAAAGAYGVALADGDSAALAAAALFAAEGREESRAYVEGMTAAAFAPRFEPAGFQRLERLRRSLAEKEVALDRKTVSSFFSILELNASGRFATAVKTWEASSGSWDKNTLNYLESLLGTYTGYDVERLRLELIFLANKGKDVWVCHTCKGEGKAKCPACSGLGYTACERCHGRGDIEERMEIDGGLPRLSHKRCPTCNRKGYAICKQCSRYTKYLKQVQVRTTAGGGTIKASGYVPCPTCHGTGRKPDAPQEVVSYSALNTRGTQERFKELTAKMRATILVTGDIWGTSPVPLKDAAEFTTDLASTPYIFFQGKWYTKEKIEEFREKRVYKEPEVNRQFLERYLAEVAPGVVKEFRGMSQRLAGKDREAVLSLARWFSFLTSAAVADSLEHRTFFVSTFYRRERGDDRILDTGSYQFFSDETGGIAREVTASIEAEYMPEDLGELLGEADEVELIYRILGCRSSAGQQGNTVRHDYALSLAPYAAVVTGKGKTVEYLRTRRVIGAGT